MDGQELEAASLRGARLRIDLAALRRNYRRIQRVVEPAEVGAVVKADAYGHGAVEVARAIESCGGRLFFVALLEEGVELRKGGIESEIVVLGVSRASEFDLYRRYRLTGTLSSRRQIESWKAFGRTVAGAPQRVHLKIDTGMTRLGLSEDEFQQFWPDLRRTPEFEVVGFLSHLIESERVDSPRNLEQEERFFGLLSSLDTNDRNGRMVHIANSAAALTRASDRCSAVRTGLALYGYDPAGTFGELESVMRLETEIVRLLKIPPGRTVGYGASWKAARPSLVATVPVGYADGYPRALGNRAKALVNGCFVDVIGAVSMDLLTIDVTDVGGSEGDPVVLLGKDGDLSIGADELGRAADTISYEILCRLGRQRLPRVYDGGEAEESQPEQSQLEENSD